MERPGIDSGSFELEEGVRLILRWDNWPAETLIWDVDARQFRDPTKPFTLREVIPDATRSTEILERIRREFATLSAHLKAIAPFQYLPSPGNWGDAIIRSGTLRFFADIGVEYVAISDPSEARADLPAVFGGSGGFCRFWNVAPRLALRLHQRCGRLVILPSTYEPDSLQAFRGLGEVTLYARERASFELIHVSHAAFVCPDMAFCNDVPDFGPATEATLNAFRTDPESLGFHTQVSGNRDLSAERNHTGCPRQFFEALAPFSTIRTDRAHVAIAAAMLGRTVHLFPNAYHKNESLFATSLIHFGVQWKGRAAD
jgi:exopolysaccharide biosynthesis predicted pyruvyltransferase EpsI